MEVPDNGERGRHISQVSQIHQNEYIHRVFHSDLTISKSVPEEGFKNIREISQ